MIKHVLLKMTFLLAITMSSITMQAQTTMGKDFYLSVGKNGLATVGSSLAAIQVRVVASKATNVTGTFTANSSLNFSFSLNAGEVRTIDLSASQKDAVYSGATGSSYKSLRIQSTESVSVYVLSRLTGLVDATNILPVNALGAEYYHFSYAPYISGGVGRDDNGYTVVAVENGTSVSENGTYKTTLNAGQVYSSYLTTNTDMTGRRITTSKPAAYFVSNTSRIPNSTVTAADNLFQQMMPVTAWGKVFFVPTTKRGVDRVRIIASQDGTNITQTGGTVKTGSLSNLGKGQFVELEITSAGCYISSNNPIGVCSYIVGYDYSLASADGDPAFAWVSPVEQFVKSTTIAPFIPIIPTASVESHYALIVAATATCDQTTVAVGTGAPTALSGGGWATGAGGYSFYSLPMTIDNKAYTIANPAGLMILGYGMVAGMAYYYLAGSSARDLRATFFVNNDEYWEVDGKSYECKDNLHIKAVLEDASATPGYLTWFVNNVLQPVTDQLEWDLTSVGNYLPAGNYTIRMHVIDQGGNPHDYETTITIKDCTTGPKIPVNPRINKNK
jgi:hypothetical protein